MGTNTLACCPKCGVGYTQEGGLTPEDIRLTPDPVPIAIGVTAPTVRISPLFEALLQSANGLLKGKNFSAAVLVAQTAIEVCTERLITKLLDRRGASFLSRWIDDSLTSYNIGSEKVRKLYQVASGDAAIAQQLFGIDSRTTRNFGTRLPTKGGLLQRMRRKHHLRSHGKLWVT
jgi:hypothetical protein